MELKKINTSNVYNHDSYPESGLFLNEHDNNVYYVSKKNLWCFCLDDIDTFKGSTLHTEKEVEDSKLDGVVSESFALKMLAINNGTKVEDLKL